MTSGTLLPRILVLAAGVDSSSTGIDCSRLSSVSASANDGVSFLVGGPGLGGVDPAEERGATEGLLLAASATLLEPATGCGRVSDSTGLGGADGASSTAASEAALDDEPLNEEKGLSFYPGYDNNPL